MKQITLTERQYEVLKAALDHAASEPERVEGLEPGTAEQEIAQLWAACARAVTP